MADEYIEGFGPKPGPGFQAGPLAPGVPGTQGVQYFDLPSEEPKPAQAPSGNFLQKLDAPFQAARGAVSKGLNWIDTLGGALPGGMGQGMIPLEAINPIPGSLPSAAGMGAAAVIPGGGILGPAKRAMGSGLATFGTASAQGKPTAFSEGVEQAAGQAAAELPFSVGRGIRGQQIKKQQYQHEQEAITKASQAHEGFQGQLDAYRQAEAAKKANFKAAEQSRVGMEQARQGQETASLTAAHNEQQAGKIASVVQSQVPAWAGEAPTAENMWQWAYGKGWKSVQDRYDTALKAVVKQGQGQMVNIRRDAADALGVRYEAQGPEPGGKGADLSFAMVDAGELAKGMTGKWLGATRGAYRQAARALDEANIGDPQARAEYRSAASFRAFADKSQALTDKQGNHVYDPVKAQVALGKLRANQEIMGRGNVPLFEAVEGAKPMGPLSFQGPAHELTPRPYTPSAPPQRPGPIPEPTVKYGPAGGASMPATGLGVLGGIAGHEMFKGMGHPFMGYMAGHAGGQALGSRIPYYSGGPSVPAPGPLGRGARAVGGSMAARGIQQAWDYITDYPDTTTDTTK